MAFIQFTGVSLAFGGRDIVKNANIFLKKGTRAALCGANGSGKSTFIKILAGVMKADSGERAAEKGCRVSYLPQSGIIHSGNTLREEAEKAFDKIKALEDRAEELRQLLQNVKEDDTKINALLEEQHLLNETVEASGYYLRDKNISIVLNGLGFSHNDIGRNVEEFSGGWQMRIALAKALLEKPDILLLDEPTNYLDIEARTWLLKWLCNFQGAYLLVSHDRYFLDTTINEVYEIFNGQLKHYAGNYSNYQALRNIEMESLLEKYKLQQEEIAKSEELIRRFRYKPTKAAMVQERIKRLEKMERIEIPESLKKIAIKLPEAPHSGRIALTLENIKKSYGEAKVLNGVNLTIETGERLVVVGPNGAGKTTLLRIIANADDSFDGNVVYGAGIKTAYFTQDAAETICGTVSVLEYLEQSAPTALIPKLRDMLGAFLFRGDDVYKAVDVLSGGEKSRLALLKMLLKPVNLLILDEPTNHLDISSKDILLDALFSYKGTIIFVSHDRAFMEKLSTKTLELSLGQEAKLFYGNYAYYLEKIEQQETQNEIQNEAQYKKPLAQNEYGGQDAKTKREQDKKQKAEMRRLEKQEAELIQMLEKLETEKQKLEEEISKPEVYTSGEKSRELIKKLEKCKSEIEKYTAEWERCAL
ncbi:ABC transporter ATP-binding protein [Spirochaetia bacterium]|nr:ABC transporter ATP-binding protein [Spirochaetia bacterium]